MPDEPVAPVPDEPIDRNIEEYIANGAAEGALAAAQRLSEAIGISLNDVLELLRERRNWQPAAALFGTGSISVGAPAGRIKVTAVAGTVSVSDGGAAADSLTVVRQEDVDKVGAEVSQSGLARLNAKYRILIAVILIAAVFPVLPPDVQAEILSDASLAAAVAAVLTLMKRR